MSRAPGRGPARFPRPILDARLGDGSRVAICVRRFGTPSFSAAQLVSQGALPAHIRDEAERVLHTCRNILLSGGTASGKTTLLNALIALIPDNQRIVAIEDTLELRIDSPNCVRFEARRLQQGALTIRDLVRHALRHRPDHIVVGEVRGAESGRPVASPQHRTRRLAHHRPCEQRRQRPVPLGELRDAGRGGELPWDVTCRGVVDGIAIVIHMTRREGRRFVEEAAVVHGYDAGTTTWDIHRLDHVTVQGRVARTGASSPSSPRGEPAGRRRVETPA